MKRLTGPIVRRFRRDVARTRGVCTSSVQVFRGRDSGGRLDWMHTWRVFVSGEDTGTIYAFSSIRRFVTDISL